MDLLYDGTYEGFLSCLYHHFAQEPASGIYREDSYQVGLIASYRTLPTNKKKADHMASLLNRHLGVQGAVDVYYAYLSEVPGWENLALSFVDLCFHEGARYTQAHTHPRVYPYDALVRKVKMEVHRYQGYVRFRQWGDGLYAKIHPQYFILPALKNHFSDRYRQEKILIHDDHRHQALLAAHGRSILIPFHRDDLRSPAPEDPFLPLWKRYVDIIAIESRVNHKLQRQFVPLKYRKDLVEMAPSTDPVSPPTDLEKSDR